VAWARESALIFGSTLQSTSTLLAVFMGGLAAGSALFARLVDRSAKPVLWYATLECGIAAYALLTPVLFRVAHSAQVAMYASLPSGHWGLDIARVLLLTVIVAPPALMMGGTLPLVAKSVASGGAGVSSSVGRLYFCNTAGAVAGAALSTFVLIASLGVTGTIVLSAAVNLVVAAGAFLFQRQVIPADGHRRPRREKVRAPQTLAPAARVLLIVAVTLSGAASLSLEVSWTRALILVLGSSVYAFGLMLVAFLTGIALGGLLAGIYAKRLRHPWRMFACLQMAIGTSAMALTASLDRLPTLFLDLANTTSRSFWALQPVSLLVIFCVMLAPTILMGAAFPIAVELWNRDAAATGRAVGHVYFVNTAGAVAGALATGFWLVPAMGLEDSVRLAGVLYVAMGAAVWIVRPVPTGWVRWAVACGAAAAVVIWLPHWRWDRRVLASGVFLKTNQASATSAVADESPGKLVYYREGLTATVAVEEARDNLVLIVNGKPDASLNPIDMETQVLLGHLPMLLHPKPERVLVVGLGSGITVGSVLRYPVSRVEVAEIEDAVVEAAALFGSSNHNALQDPRTAVVVADARTYVAAERQPYDVIIAEPSNPWVNGMASLFTREQFELYRSRLAGDGVLIQWLHLENTSADDLRIVAATFRSVFDHASLWINPSGSDVFFVGTKTPLSIDYSRLEALMSRPEIREDLVRGSLEGPVGLIGLYVVGEEAFDRFAQGAPTHTSDRPRLDYSAPRNLYAQKTMLQNLAILEERQSDVLSIVTGSRLPIRARIDAFVTSRQLAARGLSEASEGDPESAISHYRQAIDADPQNLSARTLLSLMYLASGDAAVRSGDLTEAARSFESAVDAAPAFIPARRALASTYARLGRFEDAAAQTKALLEREPGDAVGLGDYGLYLYRLGRNTEAEAELVRALTVRPSLYIVRNVLASLYLGEGRSDEASRHFLLSLEENPDQPRVREALELLASRR
jgi:spermidine synthase